MNNYKGIYAPELDMYIVGGGNFQLEGSYDSYKISPRTDMNFTGFRITHPNKPNGTLEEKYEHFRIDFDYYKSEFVVTRQSPLHSFIQGILTGPNNDATVFAMTKEALSMLQQNIGDKEFIRLMVEEMIVINNRANSVGQEMKAKDVRDRLGL